jgi:carbon storage regulator
MLVLTRKEGEGLLIGDDIRITIVEIKGNTIRIGIEAPHDKKIYRQEVYDRISRENLEAAQWNIADLELLNPNISPKKKKK